MKSLNLFLALVVLVIGISGGISVGSSAYAAMLTPSQERNVIREIDSICGDTWCEGDYNFEFKFLRCGNTGSCTLFFAMMDHNTNPVVVRLPGDTQASFRKIQAEGQCTVNQIRSYSDLMDSTSNNLNERFYSELTNCIGAIEKGLRR